MNALVLKETRLLGPAFIVALLLATLPVWLLPKDSEALTLYLFELGVVFLALSTFGREFALNTFHLMLSQPLERSRTWWTKVSLLVGAIATTFLAWRCSSVACFGSELGRFVWSEKVFLAGMISAVLFASGLWSTLLLRQVAAAFWFTILVPIAIAMLIGGLGGGESLTLIIFGLYAIAGFWWSWRHFLNLQEVGWTGGVIALPRWLTGAADTHMGRSHRPLAALISKEFQLHHVGLAGMALLFALHIGVLALRKAGQAAFGETIRAGLQVFGGIWLIVPLLLASTSVAEERKLGTMQNILCLPVSRRLQFAIKLISVLFLGGFLSATLAWAAEGIATFFGAGPKVAAFETPFDPRILGVMCLIFLVLTLVAYYASTLTSSLIQSLAVGLTIVAIIWTLGVLSSRPVEAFGIPLWRGPLVHYILWPPVALFFTWQAYRNYKTVRPSAGLWRRNALGFAGVLLFGATATAVVYQRAWELLTPLEPPHGPARFQASNLPVMRSDGGAALVALLPDRKLWFNLVTYDPGRLILRLDSGNDTGIRLGLKWVTLGGNHFVPGTNWVDADLNWRDLVALRADGTLWVSQIQQGWPMQRKAVDDVIRLVRFGEDTNWQSVVHESPMQKLLLKTDGTLWRWGTNHSSGTALTSLKPRRVGNDTDWTRLTGGNSRVYAWKKDGSAWLLLPNDRAPRKEEKVLERDLLMRRFPMFDHITWLSVAQFLNFEAGVREDGTLWVWDSVLLLDRPDRFGLSIPGMSQIGKDTNWVSITGNWQASVALKGDGSLWTWHWKGAGYPDKIEDFTTRLRRLGTNNDWVAVAPCMSGTASLAADGSLWFWWARNGPYYTSDQPLLAATRKPTKIENIFDSRQ